MMNKIREEADRLNKALSDIKKFQQQQPEGSLKCQKKGNEVFFYQQYHDIESNKWETRYIKKENVALSKKLAQKQYYNKLEPLLEKKQRILSDFIRKYRPEEMEQVYDELNEVRKALVTPAFMSIKEILRRWNTEEYESNPFHPENLRYETEQGEMVRSKSEVIIANILYQNKKHILYKYERPLMVLKDGSTKIIYPDFTMLNLHSGRIIYFEHAGKMDDPYYANEFVKKMNTYINNGLLPGKDVLVTFETMTNPLDVSVVKKMIEEFCIKI